MRPELIRYALCAEHDRMDRRILRRIHNPSRERDLIFRLRHDDTSNVDRLIASDFKSLKGSHELLFANDSSAIRLDRTERDLAVAVFGTSHLIADDIRHHVDVCADRSQCVTRW